MRAFARLSRRLQSRRKLQLTQMGRARLRSDRAPGACAGSFSRPSSRAPKGRGDPENRRSPLVGLTVSPPPPSFGRSSSPAARGRKCPRWPASAIRARCKAVGGGDHAKHGGGGAPRAKAKRNRCTNHVDRDSTAPSNARKPRAARGGPGRLVCFPARLLGRRRLFGAGKRRAGNSSRCSRVVTAAFEGRLALARRADLTGTA